MMGSVWFAVAVAAYFACVPVNEILEGLFGLDAEACKSQD